MTTAPTAEQFDDLTQQAETSRLGMWTFLASEIMFFGGLFVGYTVYRFLYPHAFIEASHELYLWIGATNTAVLMVSSITMALAVGSVAEGARKAAGILLIVTALLGVAFLFLKGFEYYKDWTDGIIPVFSFKREHFHDPRTLRQAQLFLIFYAIMTALHSVHMMCGIGAVGMTAWRTFRGSYTPDNYNTVENVGLYWSFVDMIWIFLFPLLYLPGAGV